MNITDAHLMSLKAAGRRPQRSAARKPISFETFVHLRPTPTQVRTAPPAAKPAAPPVDPFALRVLKADAKAHGETFAPETLMAGPEQSVVFMKGSDILRAWRKAGVAREEEG